MATKKLCYDDIKLLGKVRYAGNSENSPNAIGEIVAIDNEAILGGINEPIFTVKFRDFKSFFGLKYILKYYIKN